MTDVAAPPQPTLALATRPRRWLPRQVLVTRSAAELPHTAEILRRCERAGVDRIELLPADRLTGSPRRTEREIYARAKNTLAVVVAPPSALKPQPIPPSADWRIDLARGCPAHCQYCYLAGSLSGPPVTRVFANLDEVLAGIGSHAGRGTVTSGTAERGPRRHHVRAVLLHRPAGHRAPHRVAGHGHLPGRRGPLRRRRPAAVHHQVRRRGGAAHPGPHGAHPGPVLGQRRRGGGPVRGRHRPDCGPARRAARDGRWPATGSG